jgi:hypothetical protein
MKYIYVCDCGITLEYELSENTAVRDFMYGLDLHNGSDQTHLAWEHEAQR